MGHKELVVGSSFLDCRVDITLQLLCARSRLYYVPRIFTFRTLFSRASSLVFCYLFIIWYYVGTHSFETAQAAISQFTAIRVLTVVVQKQPDVTLSQIVAIKIHLLACKKAIGFFSSIYHLRDHALKVLGHAIRADCLKPGAITPHLPMKK